MRTGNAHTSFGAPRRGIGLALSLSLASIVTVAAASEPAGASTPLSRYHDAVAISVAKLRVAERKSSLALQLHRWTGSALEPIPTQFDARSADGDIDVTTAKDFVLDGNDELVFMAKDAGLRAPREALPATALAEIQLAEPEGDGRAWVYLLDTPAERAAATPYAFLDKHRAHSPYYDVEYADGRNFFTAMRILPAGGGNGTNLLRQTRMLGEPSFNLFVTDLKLSFTEKNSIVQIEGIKNGPVRAIRRVHLSVDLGPLFPEVPTGTVYTEHYLTSFTTPTRMSIPWIAVKTLEDFRFENVLEFNDGAEPLRYFDAEHPSGMPLRSETDAAFGGEHDHEWYAVSGDSGSFMQVFLMPEEWRRWGIARGAVVKPERGAGSPAPSAAGFSLLHMTRMRRPGVHELRQATIVLPRPYQPGDENEALAMFHAPLRVTVEPLH